MRIRTVAILAMAVLVAVFAPLSGAQSQLAGEWQGTLVASGAQLRLVLHVSTGKDGAIQATLDSVDQGAMGIPVSSISLKGSTLTVDAVQGTFEGTVNKDATEVDGTWSQGSPLALHFKRVAAQPAPKPAASTEFDGSWAGTLDLGTARLRIEIKVANTESGLTAKLQSPDQSPAWITASAVSGKAGELHVEFLPIGASFTGKLSADRQAIAGTFTQNGARPLTLKRVKD